MQQEQINCCASSFIRDIKTLIVSPKKYFASMAKTGGYKTPMLQVIVYWLVFSTLSYLLNLCFNAKYEMYHIWYIAFSPAIALISLFFGAAIIWCISALASGERSFEACARVSASLIIIWLFLSIFSELVFLDAFRIILIIFAYLYVFYALYCALTIALGAKKTIAKILVSALMFIVIIVMLIFAAALVVMYKYVNNYKNTQTIAPVENKISTETVSTPVRDSAVNDPESTKLLNEYMKAVQGNDKNKVEELRKKISDTSK
jgi:hypothetical protein